MPHFLLGEEDADLLSNKNSFSVSLSLSRGLGYQGSAFKFIALLGQEITLLLIHYQAPSERKVGAPNEDPP